MPRLVIHPGTPQAKEIPLKPGANYLGRGFANDFQINDGSVSTSHCQILVNGDVVTVKDLGSTNGTFINRTAVQEASLQPGQMLRLGAVEIAFEGDAPTIVATTAPVMATAASAAPPAPAMGGLRISGSAPAAAAPPPPMGGLRISGSSKVVEAEAPPVAVAEPPVPPALEAVPARPAGKTNCKFHPKSPSRWLCPKCGQQYCDLCVSTRATNSGTAHLCRPCAVECSPVSVVIDVGAMTRKANFFVQLPEAFSYPFRRGGAYLLVGGSVFLAILESALNISLPFILWVLQIMFRIMFLGYLFAYMQNVIHSTANGDQEEPSLPSVTGWGELLMTGLQLIVTILLSFGPAIGLAIWGLFYGGGPMGVVAAVAAAGIGCLYFPMAFLSVAMFDSWTGVNPLLVIPAISKVPLQYLVTCIILGLIVATRSVGVTYLPMLISIPFVPFLLASFIGLYFLTVECRILGILYFCNKQKFGWFRR
jgi:hypothetical protein